MWAHGQSGWTAERRWNEMKAQLTKLNINCRNVSNNFLPHFVLNSPSSTTRFVCSMFTKRTEIRFFSLPSRQSFSPSAACCDYFTAKNTRWKSFCPSKWLKCIFCGMLIAEFSTFVVNAATAVNAMSACPKNSRKKNNKTQFFDSNENFQFNSDHGTTEKMFEW